MEQDVTFRSGDLNLSGVVHTPDDLAPGERRPAILVLHGFGSRKAAQNVVGPTNMFLNWGYVVLRFDMRGCGDSDGAFGHILCEDQVADTRAAVSFMRERAEVDPDRIGVVGSSFGAAVAVYAAGIDDRIAAVISSGGWGNAGSLPGGADGGIATATAASTRRRRHGKNSRGCWRTESGTRRRPANR